MPDDKQRRDRCWWPTPRLACRPATGVLPYVVSTTDKVPSFATSRLAVVSDRQGQHREPFAPCGIRRGENAVRSRPALGLVVDRVRAMKIGEITDKPRQHAIRSRRILVTAAVAK